jgi:hypothetical protein
MSKDWAKRVYDTNLSKQQIDEVVADNMYRTEFLQALMQEMPNIQIIPIGFDER